MHVMSMTRTETSLRPPSAWWLLLLLLPMAGLALLIARPELDLDGGTSRATSGCC